MYLCEHMHVQSPPTAKKYRMEQSQGSQMIVGKSTWSLASGQFLLPERDNSSSVTCRGYSTHRDAASVTVGQRSKP